ncbi:MAG: TonB-dependent receptor plug domain-containing protein [Treponema sp.]|jgi:hypothetical protein|nr:TonB-dependent receptor plug domain-containing protein [Treponema sp.]
MASFAGKIFAAWLLLFSALVFARDIEITVIDGDLSIPLEGARVVSPDGSERICDAEGRALVSVPDDRPAVLRISYPGYAPGRVLAPPGADACTAELSLAGTAEERELIVEAPRPGSSETVSGRSVAISGSNLTMPAETGIIGDVMNAVKLLPGVGYVGGYMAMPSVRGGEPSDVTAVFDGFYVERPYHWGGAFSIFDPKMVESAQLSHGVFSTRYGHTISGLLDIHARRPSPESAGLELAVSSSATNLNLSFPLGGKGGLSLMGKVTYWDPFVEAAKLFFEEVRYVSTTPFIRSGAFGAAYDFSTDLSLSLNGFFGNDGAGAYYDDNTSTSIYGANFYWDNKIGFLTSGLSYSPNSRSLVKVTLGAGLLQTDLDGRIYSENITASTIRNYSFFVRDRTINFQGRADYDLDLGNGFLFAAGAEERYSRWDRINTFRGTISDDPVPNRERSMNVLNQGLFSSAYSLFEYTSENRRFGMEAGIRGDHFLLAGEGYTLPGMPALNPRINLDFLLLEDSGPLESMTMTAGTGFFSSVNSSLQNISSANNIKRDASTQNRSWTTVAGTKIDFLSGFSFTFEAYFKYVFDRAYTINDSDDTGGATVYETNYYFDGEALIWGFDTMLQKFDSRYWNGWISYSYINARYRDPESTALSRNEGNWYYPGFHRFHTLNLIVNYKPVKTVNLMTRFSLASGIPLLKTAEIIGDPAVPGAPPPYKRIQVYDDYSRAGLVIPLDIKLSFFSFNKNGKAKRELYLSFENLLSLVYRAEGTKDFDENTGRETPGSSIASYDLPIPLITFGIKWSY